MGNIGKDTFNCRNRFKWGFVVLFMGFYCQYAASNLDMVVVVGDLRKF